MRVTERVLEIVSELHLINEDKSVVFGTIEEAVVLSSLESLRPLTNSEEHQDAIGLAIAEVKMLRSAGHETVDENSVFATLRNSETQIQMRGRQEVRSVLYDLAIDLALSEKQEQHETI